LTAYYNIGAGNFSHPDWINVDFPSEHYRSVQAQQAFIAHDLMSCADLPIETGSADIVYCSHTIEHVTDEAVQKMLDEAYRVLKPGGGLRLVTPDIALAHRNWLRRERRFFNPRIISTGYGIPPIGASVTQMWLHHFASQLSTIDADDTAVRKFSDAEIEAVFADSDLEIGLDYFCKQARFNPRRPENHINWFDEQKLTEMVMDAGFVDVWRSGLGQSVYPAMRDVQLFDRHYAISLYVEASKE